jgi:hypothetical protein
MKEEQLREDQRREALARKEQEPHGEETLPPPARVEEPVQQVQEAVQQVRETVQQAPETVQQVRETAPPPARPQVEEPRIEQPKVDPKALLESSGLVMIETDRSKAPPPPASEEPQQLGRPRRERAKQAPPQDDSLEQVETRK